MVLDHLIISFVVLNVVLHLWSVRVGTSLCISPAEVLQNLEKDLRLRS